MKGEKDINRQCESEGCRRWSRIRLVGGRGYSLLRCAVPVRTPYQKAAIRCWIVRIQPQAFDVVLSWVPLEIGDLH